MTPPRKPCRHPPPVRVLGCPHCAAWPAPPLWEYDPATRGRRWVGPGDPPPAAAKKAAGAGAAKKQAGRVSLPCVHRGPEATGPERQALKLGHSRKWFKCNHPDLPLGKEYVCSCAGCGNPKKCKGYTPSKETD